MFPTRFAELIGCTVPMQQAAMGGIATPELAAAVSDAGGWACSGLRVWRLQWTLTAG
ncbi:MAG: nitronate monooxygenase [Chloroflexi bacterium]|nr:nitronate monooxygenase [Chloroflexota bacterium]